MGNVKSGNSATLTKYAGLVILDPARDIQIIIITGKQCNLTTNGNNVDITYQSTVDGKSYTYNLNATGIYEFDTNLAGNLVINKTSDYIDPRCPRGYHRHIRSGNKDPRAVLEEMILEDNKK